MESSQRSGEVSEEVDKRTFYNNIFYRLFFLISFVIVDLIYEPQVMFVLIVGTVIIRLLLFPLVIMSQRNAAKMNNYLPQMQAIQLKMTEARQTGNQIDAARYGQELMIFMTEKQLNPLKNMIVPLAQVLFIRYIILCWYIFLTNITRIDIGLKFSDVSKVD